MLSRVTSPNSKPKVTMSLTCNQLTHASLFHSGQLKELRTLKQARENFGQASTTNGGSLSSGVRLV